MTKTIEEIYKKQTQHESILSRPDTYIGSITPINEVTYISNTTDITSKDLKFYKKKIEYIPGFFKIIDEVLSNAIDHSIRDIKVSYIKINLTDDGYISITNDGSGIPIEIHKDYNIYVAEMIFGNLLTSSNYNDNDDRLTSGRNGVGVKLCNIYSKEFIVTTIEKNQKYIQNSD